MGNANALMQSDDWAALIADAKARNCYMDMESLPKEFLISKGPANSAFPSRFSSGPRGMRPGALRPRSFDMSTEHRTGTVSEEEKSKHYSNRKD